MTDNAKKDACDGTSAVDITPWLETKWVIAPVPDTDEVRVWTRTPPSLSEQIADELENLCDCDAYRANDPEWHDPDSCPARRLRGLIGTLGVERDWYRDAELDRRNEAINAYSRAERELRKAADDGPGATATDELWRMYLHGRADKIAPRPEP